MDARIVVLPGDGVGSEVVAAAVEVLKAIAERYDHRFTFVEALIGGAAIDAVGSPFPEKSLAACRSADAVLLGAVGGPAWADPGETIRPEQGLLALRRELDLFANLRPVRVIPCLSDASPIRSDRLAGIDLLIVRELTSGIYFGRRREATSAHRKAYDTMEYTEGEIQRIAHVAFRLAAERRGKVTLVDKANVLACSRLWRQVVADVASEHPEVNYETILVDAAAMYLIQRPGDFDVLLTANMFGDILADEASVLCGSMGMLPSASLGSGPFGVYEPIHGSAPDIAGCGTVNPIATILSAAMLLRYSLALPNEAATVESAVEEVLENGYRTPDIATGGTITIGTEGLTERIVASIHEEGKESKDAK